MMPIKLKGKETVKKLKIEREGKEENYKDMNEEGMDMSEA